MRCFIMKALTLKGKWFPFTLEDVPTRFNKEEFALLKRPNTPRLLLKELLRGDPESGLYEGDIIKWREENWMVCYERGFYIINEKYVTQTLDQLDNYELVGNCFDMEFPIPILRRNKCLFKYNNVVFRLDDIVGPCGNNHIILRSFKDPVPIADIQQDAGIMRNKLRLYFGDITNEGVVDLYKGRIVYRKDNTIVDVITGGSL